MEKTTKITLNGKLHTATAIVKALCDSGLKVSNIEFDADSITITGIFVDSPVKINICNATCICRAAIKFIVHDHF